MKHHYYFCKNSTFNSHATLDAASDKARVKLVKTGFTLAEVLITLGIIGVVAALTMPALINNYKKISTVTALKKVYSTFAQSVQYSETEYGDIDQWDWELRPDEFFKKYICRNCKIIKDCENKSGCWNPTGSFKLSGGLYSNPNTNTNVYTMIMNDGKTYTLEKQDNIHIHIGIDLNGLKGPNVIGKDIFLMTLTNGAHTDHSHKITKSGLYMFGHGLSETELKTATYACAKNRPGLTCSEKILYDGWQIKSDYPWN